MGQARRAGRAGKPNLPFDTKDMKTKKGTAGPNAKEGSQDLNQYRMGKTICAEGYKSCIKHKRMKKVSESGPAASEKGGEGACASGYS